MGGRRLPPVPKEHDVEQHGKYSAGTLRLPKNAKTAAKKSPPPANLNWDDPAAMDP